MLCNKLPPGPWLKATTLVLRSVGSQGSSTPCCGSADLVCSVSLVLLALAGWGVFSQVMAEARVGESQHGRPLEADLITAHSHPRPFGQSKSRGMSKPKPRGGEAHLASGGRDCRDTRTTQDSDVEEGPHPLTTAVMSLCAFISSSSGRWRPSWCLSVGPWARHED